MLNGKGTFVESPQRKVFKGVTVNVLGRNGGVFPSAIEATTIQYIDTDLRDGSTLIFRKEAEPLNVKDTTSNAANHWGQRENVVKYKRASNEDRLLEVAFRVDDILEIYISTQDCYTVRVRTRWGSFPVVGKHERIVEKAAYCRPFAVFQKKSDKQVTILTAVPIDNIVKIDTSFADGTTLVKTCEPKIVPVVESVDDVVAIIDKSIASFEAAQIEMRKKLKEEKKLGPERLRLALERIEEACS